MSDLSISNRPYNPTPVHPTACGATAQAATHLAQGKPVPGGLARAAGNAVQCGLLHANAALSRLSERQVADGLRRSLPGKFTEAQLGKLAKTVTELGGPGTRAGKTILAMAAGEGKAFEKTNNCFLKLGGFVDGTSALSTELSAVLEYFPRAGTVNAAAGTLLSIASIPLTMNGIGYMRLDGERRAKLEGPLKALTNVMRHLEENGGSMHDPSRLKSASQKAFPESHFGRAFDGRSEFLAVNRQPAGVKAYDAECRHWYEALQAMPQGDRENLARGFKSAMQVLHGASDWNGIERAMRQKAGL